MSNPLQQQQQQQQQQQAAAGFYPSSGYYHEPKSLVPATSTSVYDQSMTLPPHSNVEQEMVDAVAAFSTTSLPPLSQLLPSSTSTTTKPRPTHPSAISGNETPSNRTTTATATGASGPTMTKGRAYSHPTINNSNDIASEDLALTPSTTITTAPNSRSSSMYQPSPTVMSHRKVSSNHPDIYYRSPVVSTAVTPPTATTNDPYYLSMPGYNNPTSGDMVPQQQLPNASGNGNVNSIHFSPGMVASSMSTTPSTVPSHPSPYTSTSDIHQHARHIPPAPTVRHRHSQQGIYHTHPYSYPQPQHQHLPSPPSSYDQYPMEQQQSQKVFSFVSLPGVNQKKRPRRKYHEVERLYHCNYLGCAKSYGTLNHLNAHVQMQDHGPKRHPSEFKELRKMWRKQKRESQGKNKKTASSQQQQPMEPQRQHNQPQQQQQQQQASPHHSVQSHLHIQPPPVPTHQVQPMIHHPLPPPPPLPTVLYPPPSNHWMAPPQANISHLHHPQQQQHTAHPHHQAAAAAAAAAAAGFPTHSMNY